LKASRRKYTNFKINADERVLDGNAGEERGKLT